jgi:hypothetical protein
VTEGSRPALESRIRDLRDRAAALAAAQHAQPATTTHAIERATLRMLGVNGVDRDGNPLAAVVVERLAEGGPQELGGGVALPLAAAASARGIGVQEAALEVAGGAIDLALEAQFLQHPDRRAAAEELLEDWTAEAFQRVDANRTARREISDALGLRDHPWLCARIDGFALDQAIAEAREFVAAGADALIVRVPRGRELVVGTGEPGVERTEREMDPPPAGSQRGLAELRVVLDEIAAERGAYLSLATTTDGLAAPEQAVVAAFERIDIVFADPFDEIALGIDAQRAFTDHAAALRLLGRSGTTVVLGPGPLLAGPELARGEALTSVTRIGRSIAAQAMSVAWAEAANVPRGSVLASAPFEAPFEAISGGSDPGAEGALLLAGLTVRKLLHEGHGLVIAEPWGVDHEAWQLALPLSLLGAGDAALVVHQGPPAEFRARSESARSGAALARVLGAVLPAGARTAPLPLADEVLTMATELATVAIATLELAAHEGWESLVATSALTDGRAPGQEPGRLGRAGLVPAPVYAGPLGVGGTVEGG